MLTSAPGSSLILFDIPDLSDGNISAGYIHIIEQNLVALVSSSFGGCEKFDSPQYNNGQSYFGILDAEHELFLQGNSQGITFLASSGDNAGKECPGVAYFSQEPSVFEAGVETPAADPNVSGVGGTNLVTGYDQGSLTSPYVGENGWVDQLVPEDPYGVGALVSGGLWGAGGGYSIHFKQPTYQKLVSIGSATRRAIPDVGMEVGGCPFGAADYNPTLQVCNGDDKANNGSGNTQRSAVAVALDYGLGGGFYGIIGTSVASPEFAGATALLIEQKGRMGNLNPYLYRWQLRRLRGMARTSTPGSRGSTA